MDEINSKEENKTNLFNTSMIYHLSKKWQTVKETFHMFEHADELSVLQELIRIFYGTTKFKNVSEKEHTASYGKRLINEAKKSLRWRRFSMHFEIKRMLKSVIEMTVSIGRICNLILENLSWNCFPTWIWWTSECYSITKCFTCW